MYIYLYVVFSFWPRLLVVAIGSFLLWINDDDFTCSNQFWNTFAAIHWLAGYGYASAIVFKCCYMPSHIVYIVCLWWVTDFFPLKHTTRHQVWDAAGKTTIHSHSHNHKHSNLNFNDDDDDSTSRNLCVIVNMCLCVYVFNAAIQSWDDAFSKCASNWDKNEWLWFL